MTDLIVDLVKVVTSAGEALYNLLPERKVVEKDIEVVVKQVEIMQPRPGGAFVRIAGVSGAIAVALGAYGAHVFREKEKSDELKQIYDTGNRYHFLHTLGLLAVPLTNRPYLVGGLMTTGMVLFSGSCYYHALTGNKALRKVTPYGGMLLIAAWLCMAL